MIATARSISCALLSAGLLAALGGCAHTSDNPVVPSSAMQMSTGNREIAFTAPHDGTVYVRDDNDNRVVYSGDVSRGQVVRYDPRAQNVTVDDSVAASAIPGYNHNYSIFFQRTGALSESTAGGAMSASPAAPAPTTQPADSMNPKVPIIRVPVGVEVQIQTQPAGGQ